MDAFYDEGTLVAVLTTQPLDRALDYKAPEGGCWQGAYVEVPLGPRKVLGVVWGPGQGDFDYARVRSVISARAVSATGRRRSSVGSGTVRTPCMSSHIL